MAYFDLNYVTDPPDDETTDYQTQLNDNWQEIADKTDPFNHKPAEFGSIEVPVGTEAFDPEHSDSYNRVAVWTGSQWARSVNHSTTWTVWQNIGIFSPRVIRPGFPLQAKINAVSRRIVLRGGVLFNTAADAWPTGTTYEISDAVSIQPELGPVNGESIQQAATGQITTANGFASAAIVIQKLSDRTAISVRYQGDAGGGNFVMLDGIEWWY